MLLAGCVVLNTLRIPYRPTFSSLSYSYTRHFISGFFVSDLCLELVDMAVRRKSPSTSDASGPFQQCDISSFRIPYVDVCDVGVNRGTVRNMAART